VVGESEIVVVCKATSDPANSGAIVRAAAAFGASKVIFTNNSVDHWSPKVVRGSSGGVFLLPIASIPTVEAASELLHDMGFVVVAADLHGTKKNPAQNLRTIVAKMKPKHSKIALLFGNEAHGLDEAEINLSDYTAKIDISDRIDSINLAAAVHIFLYEFTTV
jgi:TrmH family RNA methyltransferase